ncbi:unnamed protein product, partial [marine sediment metagenome]
VTNTRTGQEESVKDHLDRIKKESHTITAFKNQKTYKEVPYNEIKPHSDGLAYYKGKMYGTKEDLKYFPKKVRLVELTERKKILAPSPFQVIEASKRKPDRVVKFKNEMTALQFRSKNLKEGKIALLGSREMKGGRIYEVEVFNKKKNPETIRQVERYNKTHKTSKINLKTSETEKVKSKPVVDKKELSQATYKGSSSIWDRMAGGYERNRKTGKVRATKTYGTFGSSKKHTTTDDIMKMDTGYKPKSMSDYTGRKKSSDKTKVGLSK